MVAADIAGDVSFFVPPAKPIAMGLSVAAFMAKYPAPLPMSIAQPTHQTPYWR